MGSLLINFDDSLRTGNALLDSQHEELFRRANQVFLTAEEDRPRRMFELLDFLRTYVLFHFDREEEIMARIRFDVADEHIAAHNVFRSAVEEIWTEQEVHGYSAELYERLQDMFAVRFVRHVQTLDKELALHLTSGEISFD